MSRLPVYTEAPGGGDRVPLDVIGEVEGLRYTSGFPTGDLTANWQMRLDPTTDHRALAPGRRVRIPFGASKGWRGYLDNPQRGDVWTFTATGYPATAARYAAIAPTTGNTLKLDEVVDAAIGRGWDAIRPSALPSLATGAAGGGSMVADALNTVTQAKGTYWVISRGRNLTASTLPTNVAYLLMATDNAGGRQLGGFATDVIVTYLNAATYTVDTITRSVPSKPFGTFEVALDLTGDGPLNTSDAQGRGDNHLARFGARLRFTGAWTIRYGDLLNPGGAPVDLATVQALDGQVRVMVTDPDSAAGELTLGATKVMPGQVEYDVDADVLTLTPLDRTPTGLAAVFS